MTDRRPPGRVFALAAAAGGLLGGLVFAWLLTAGSTNLLRWQLLGDFYDAQAHAFLDGDLAVDGEVLGIEAFDVDGRSYMYQGPVPALLRLPVVAVAGDRFDGRLTQLSMLAALAVATAAAASLHWRVRRHLRGDEPVGRGEMALVAALAFSTGGGGLLLFQASRAWIYHEAILWGAALSLAALDQLVAHRLAPSGRTLARCAALTAAALLTRASVALGPVTGLGLVLVLALWRRRRAGDERDRVTWWQAGIALAAPVAAYAAVNAAKFGSAFGVPFRSQRLALVDPARQAFLDGNDGTFFGAEFVPTTLVRYLDPLGIRPMTRFPFVDFPIPPGRVVGGADFDLLDRVAGLPPTAPLLVVLTLTAVVVARRHAGLGLPLLAAAASAATVLPFGYLAQRYIGDAAPLLALGGAVGLQWLLHRWPGKRVIAGGVVALAGVGALVSLALGLQYQRLWSTNAAAGLRAAHLGAQLDVGTGDLPVRQVGSLPRVGPSGVLVAVGNCDGLYLSDGMPVTGVDRTPWNGVEGTRATGWFHLRLAFPDAPAGTVTTLLEDGATSVTVEDLGGGRLRFEHRTTDGLGKLGRPVRITRDKELDVRVVADWRIDRLTVEVGDRLVLESFYGHRDPLTVVAAGATERPVTAPLCRRLLDR